MGEPLVLRASLAHPDKAASSALMPRKPRLILKMSLPARQACEVPLCEP